MTLHDGSHLYPGEWWACSQPERPGGPYEDVVYDENCPACRIKATADLLAIGDAELVDCEDDSPCLLSEVADGTAAA